MQFLSYIQRLTYIKFKVYVNLAYVCTSYLNIKLRAWFLSDDLIRRFCSCYLTFYLLCYQLLIVSRNYLIFKDNFFNYLTSFTLLFACTFCFLFLFLKKSFNLDLMQPITHAINHIIVVMLHVFVCRLGPYSYVEPKITWTYHIEPYTYRLDYTLGHAVDKFVWPTRKCVHQLSITT